MAAGNPNSASSSTSASHAGGRAIAGGAMSTREIAELRMLGRYALFGEIARGGMATVHFGRLLGPVGFSRTVAIKRLHSHLAGDTEFVSMFVDEARLAARIQHPNVVPTLDVIVDEGEVALVMEYVQGESLSRLLNLLRSKQERVPLRIAGAVMGGVLAGLHAAHEAKDEDGQPLGIVHRDMSPQNVMVGQDGVVRVFDFGVAKAAGRADTTRQGIFKGKLAYAAPEQVEGGPVDRRIDIFAASVVLWEMLTGRRLYKADNEIELFKMVREGRIEHPSSFAGDLPEGLGWVVMKGLSVDPERRFHTALELAIALERVVPSASSREVAAWLQQVAPDTLLSRTKQIEQIESASKASTDSGVRELTLVASQPTSMAPEPETSRRVRVVGAVLIGVIAMLLMAVVALARQRDATSTASARSTASDDRAPAHIDGRVAEKVAPKVTAASAPIVTAVASSALPSTAPEIVVKPVPSVVKPIYLQPNPTVVVPAKASCSPPYTVDGDGIRHIKPECM